MQIPNYPIIDAENAKRLGVANIDTTPHASIHTLTHNTYLDDMCFPRDKLKESLVDCKMLPLVVVACGSFSPVT